MPDDSRQDLGQTQSSGARPSEKHPSPKGPPAQGPSARDPDADRRRRPRLDRGAGARAPSRVPSDRRSTGASGFRNLQHTDPRTDPLRSPAASRRPTFARRTRGRPLRPAFGTRRPEGAGFPGLPGIRRFGRARHGKGSGGVLVLAGRVSPAGPRNAWALRGWRSPATTVSSPGGWRPWAWPWARTARPSRSSSARIISTSGTTPSIAASSPPARRGC